MLALHIHIALLNDFVEQSVPFTLKNVILLGWVLGVKEEISSNDESLGDED